MFKLLTTAFALIVGYTSAVETGFMTSIDVAVIEQAKDAYFQKILKAINGIEIPDVRDDKGNYLTGNSFHISEGTKYVEFIPREDQNAVVLANKKVSAYFKSKHFRYHAAPLVTAKGYAEVDLNTVDIEIGIAFRTQIIDGSQHIIPYVESVDVKADINRHDIKIHLHGNLLTDIGSMFEIFFKGIVAGLIEDTIKATLNVAVPTVTNNILEAMDGELPIPLVKDWILDWQTQEPVQVHKDWIGFGSRGLFFDQTIGRELTDLPAIDPGMTYKDTSRPEKFQNWLSAYTINSMFNSVTEVAPLQGMLKSQMLGNLNCGELITLLPGLPSTYGADQPVDVFINVHSLGNFHSYKDNQEMKLQTDLDLQFWVHTTDGDKVYAAGLGLETVKLGFQALTNDMTVTMALTQLNVGKVNILQSTIGNLSPTSIKLEINNGFRVAKPIINKLLADKPLAFPTSVFGLFELEAMTLGYYDDYIYAGITPVFIGPKSYEAYEVSTEEDEATIVYYEENIEVFEFDDEDFFVVESIEYVLE